MTRYLPEAVFYENIEGRLTNQVRSIIKSDWRGHCPLRTIFSVELSKLTTLEGQDFVKAWLDAVKCHTFLWQHGIEYGDPSLWNIMYNSVETSGILVDFDLTILKGKPRSSSINRTGTIPFMAVELLTDEYWRGELTRSYFHELEAFIWVLPFVFLGYRNKEFQVKSPVNAWKTSDHNKCREKKSDMLIHPNLYKSVVQDGFKKEWYLVTHLLAWMNTMNMKRSLAASDKLPVWSEFIEGLYENNEGWIDLPYLRELFEAVKSYLDFGL